MPELKEEMKVLVVGGGGREHAILEALSRSPYRPELFVTPGNPGMRDLAQVLPGDVMDFEGILETCKAEQIDFVVVSPDNPLCGGLVDYLEEEGFPCFGPIKKAARLEGSKAFAKAFMKEHGIPTASYEVFDSVAEAKAYIENMSEEDFPRVLKADGLALGKGVSICPDQSTALEDLKLIMEDHKFGTSGDKVVIEEFMTGPEVSLLCLSDGKDYKVLLSSMDHKAVGEGNVGPNTGGMGVVAPNPYLTKDLENQVVRTILEPTIRGMAKAGTPFKGCLFLGLMLTAEGPKVIEYNARFGDPEAEAILPMLKSDLLALLVACRKGNLADFEAEFYDGVSLTLMLCSEGYPGSYEKGKVIHFAPEFTEKLDRGQIHLYHSGTAWNEEQKAFVTNGGRVLAINARGKDLDEARALTYGSALEVCFDGVFYRQDIGLMAYPDK